MKTEPNSPAMPVTGVGHQSTGLTIREEFAKAAMQGLLADGTSESHYSDLADRAVCIADYLIEALNKPQS